MAIRLDGLRRLDRKGGGRPLPYNDSPVGAGFIPARQAEEGESHEM